MEGDNSLQGVKEHHDRKEAACIDHLLKGHSIKRRCCEELSLERKQSQVKNSLCFL